MTMTSLYFLYGGEYASRYCGGFSHSRWIGQRLWKLSLLPSSYTSRCYVVMSFHTQSEYHRRLLGWSAFAGFLVLVAGLVFNLCLSGSLLNVGETSGGL